MKMGLVNGDVFGEGDGLGRKISLMKELGWGRETGLEMEIGLGTEMGWGGSGVRDRDGFGSGRIWEGESLGREVVFTSALA